MRNLFYSLLSLSAILPIHGILAQDLKDVPPPKAPFVAPVPENADWLVTMKSVAAPTPAPDGVVRPNKSIISVQSTKAGRYKRDRITSADGTIEERWWVDMLLLWPTKEGDVAVTDKSSVALQAENSNPSVPRGFPGVGWLKPEYFEDVVLIAKRPSYHFVHDSTEAWIDVETKLPLAYKAGGTTFQFTFNAPPTGPLTMPEAYQKSLTIVEKAAAYRQKLQKDLAGGR